LHPALAIAPGITLPDGAIDKGTLSSSGATNESWDERGRFDDTTVVSSTNSPRGDGGPAVSVGGSTNESSAGVRSDDSGSFLSNGATGAINSDVELLDTLDVTDFIESMDGCLPCAVSEGASLRGNDEGPAPDCESIGANFDAVEKSTSKSENLRIE
jgi:hypothetical protein